MSEGIGYGLLVAAERKAGCRILHTGEVPWLRADDWRGEPVITQRGNDVRIVAVWARREGQGTFSRLVRDIEAAGFTPVVVAPFAQMEAILTKWGWTGNKVGDDEEWRPTKAIALPARPADEPSPPSDGP